MHAMLDMFKLESGELRKLKEEKTKEQLMINRLIKNEVIDMADRLERLEEVMANQSSMLFAISNKLDRNRLNSELTSGRSYGGEGEESESQSSSESSSKASHP